ARLGFLPRRLVRALEIGEEAVDDPRRLRVVAQALPDDAGGQAQCERADLAAQRDERALALRLDRGLCGCRDAVRLELGLLLELVQDLRAVETCLLTDLRRLATGVGELGAVLLECRIRLCLR